MDAGNVDADSIDACRAHLFPFRDHRLAGFAIDGKCMVCLPQVYEAFLKHLVGGLHTIYTKLKRLGIQTTVCNVAQVRALRMAGAIQCGVNRCKLMNITDLPILLADCEDVGTRPGRPAKRLVCDSVDGSRPCSSTMVSPSMPCSLHLFNDLLSWQQNLALQQVLAAAVSKEVQRQCNASLQNSPLFNVTPVPPLLRNSSSVPPNDQIIQRIPDQQAIAAMASNSQSNIKNELDVEEKPLPESTMPAELAGASTWAAEKSSSDSNDSISKGNNSETDTTFDREKSMSINFPDSGSGASNAGSGAHSTSPPSTDSRLQNRLISLIDTAESVIKNQGDRLGELVAHIHNELRELSKRDRLSRIEASVQKQKAVHYHRRYAALKYSRHHCHHHHHFGGYRRRRHNHNGNENAEETG